MFQRSLALEARVKLFTSYWHLIRRCGRIPNIAVKAVGAGLDGGVDDAALEVPEFGRGILGNQVELLNGVGRRV